VPSLNTQLISVQSDGFTPCGASAPHFSSLKQYIVAWPQEEKCGLKYVI
jgi:hypothetical protein